jgi:hypothetical protein
MYIVCVNQKVARLLLFFSNKKVDLYSNCVIIYVQLENRRSYMKKMIQITGIVKEYKELTLIDTGKTVEDFMRVEYETGKHDSISSAEAELLTMMDYTQASGSVTDIKLVKTIYNFVECYKDEMELKYGS